MYPAESVELKIGELTVQNISRRHEVQDLTKQRDDLHWQLQAKQNALNEERTINAKQAEDIEALTNRISYLLKALNEANDRIIAMTPQKQFRVLAYGEYWGGLLQKEILAVNSSNGVTTITIK